MSNDELEDLESTEDALAETVLPEGPRPSFRDDRPKPKLNVTDVICPECKCDYVVPLMQIKYINSFAGNKMQIVWPSQEGANDWGLVSCASCWEIIKISTEGALTCMGKKLGGKK